jgi:rod shape-determining protein MreC
MYQLFQFVSRQRAFILFIVLEAFSLWCYYKYNDYANAIYFNTSNYYVAKVLETQNSIREYANLRTVNADLATENARLNQMVSMLQGQKIEGNINYTADSLVRSRFKVTVAKMVGGDFNNYKNYITLDKGSAEGIRPGMGVISATGVVGKVKACSEHFSVVITILHQDYSLSAKLKRSGEIGSIRWEGTDPYTVKMLDVSRFKPAKINDTIMTSDFNAVFPANIMVGVIKKLGVQEDQAHHDISVRLSTDFRNLSYVYVVDNSLKTEQESLETTATKEIK